MISNVVSRSPRQGRAEATVSLQSALLKLRVVPLVGLVTLFFMAAVNLVNVELTDEKVTLDWQLMVKLAMVALAGAYGTYGFILDARVRRVLTSPPAIWLSGLCLVYLAAGFVSITKVVSIVSAGCVLCAVLAITTFSVQQGRDKILRLMFGSLGIFVVGSWAVYLLLPQYGVFMEPLPGGAFYKRMGGLSHPNTLGQFCGFTIIIGSVLLRQNKFHKRIAWAIVILAVLGLWFSLSRTSSVATVLGMVVVFRDKIWNRQLVVGGMILAAVGLSTLIVGSAFSDIEERVASKFTGLLMKSSDSDVDELSSGTGRNVIWAKAISLIQERPLTGWGAGTSKELLKDYSRYTHNLFLNIWLSSGVLGGSFVTILMLLMLYKVAFSPSMLPDALIVFIFLNGLLENVIFTNVASAPTLIFALAVIWRTIPERTPAEPDSEPEMEGRRAPALS